MAERDFCIINKSPPGQYCKSKTKIKETGEEIHSLYEYENAIIVSDDILGSSNNKNIDQVFMRRRHIKLYIYYLSQSYFDLANRTVRNNSNKIFLFIQTLRDIEKYTGTLLDMI